MKPVLSTLELARRIRRHAVEMRHLGRSSHVGSVLSMADIVAVLYGAVLKKDPKNPKWPDRDRFILSKGHAGAGFYAALADSTAGSNNNARGSYALAASTTGYGNIAMGANSLLNLTIGFRDVGVGNKTGISVVAGSYDYLQKLDR